MAKGLPYVVMLHQISQVLKPDLYFDVGLYGEGCPPKTVAQQAHSESRGFVSLPGLLFLACVS